MKSNVKVFVKNQILSPWHFFSLMETRLLREAIASPAAFSRDGCFSAWQPCPIEPSGRRETARAGILLLLSKPQLIWSVGLGDALPLTVCSSSFPGTPCHALRILAATSLWPSSLWLLLLLLLTSIFKSCTPTSGFPLSSRPHPSY